MLLEFRLENFQSYATEKRFSVVAGSGKELPGNTMAVEGFGLPLLRSAVIYGANASGKSNLVHAIAFLKNFVLRSSETRQDDEPIPVLPFLLDEKLADRPSQFEITFLMDGVRHQYGVVASRERVHEEWLTVYPKGKPQEWFHRTVNAKGASDWSWSRTHLKGDKISLAERTRENALFLSVAAQWNHAQLTPVYRWFSNHLHVLRRQTSVMGYTRGQLKADETFREWLTQVLRSADTGIQRLLVKERTFQEESLRIPSYIPQEMRKRLADGFRKEFEIEVRTIRRVRGTKAEVEWALSQESDGTQRMLELLGPIYDVLQRGAVLVMDELDTSLHAYLTRELVQLFHNPTTNPKNAQLVFTTHDTSLLDPSLFRRDQIWFTEKDDQGRTELYSLEEFSPRIGEPLQKGYLAGRYGGVPNLEKFDAVPPSAKKRGKAKRTTSNR